MAVHDSYWTSACFVDAMNEVYEVNYVEALSQNCIDMQETIYSIAQSRNHS